MSITTQGKFPRLLQEGVNTVATSEVTMKQKDMEYNKIFTTHKSDKAYEIDVSMSGMGLASQKPEGTAISYDGQKQDFTTKYENTVYAIGGIITMEAQMNNLWQNAIKTNGKMIARSLMHTDEQLAANVINNGYDSSFALGDGQPLFSQSHVLGKGGTFANANSTFASLSQAAIEDALIEIADYRDGANLLIQARGVSLHVPRQLQFTAQKILDSKFEPDSGNNAINTSHGIFKDGFHVNHRFTSATEWFIKTDVEDGFKRFERMGYTFSSDNDFGTDNHRSKGMFYVSYGVTDPRACYGSGQ